MVTVLDVFVSRQKTLTLPQGGNLVYNAAWPQADMNKTVGDAIDGFLLKEELLHR